MGWFTGGWFTEGWFSDSAATATTVTPTIISAVSSAPGAVLKLGQRQTTMLSHLAISNPDLNMRIGIRAMPAVLPLNSDFSYKPGVKTGVRNQVQSLLSRLLINTISTKTGIKFFPGCSSLSNRFGNPPLLRAGTKQNIISFNMVPSLQEINLRIGVRLSSDILDLMVGQIMPKRKIGVKLVVLPWLLNEVLHNVKIKSGIKTSIESLSLLSQLLLAKGGTIKGALPILVPLSLKLIENITIDGSDSLIGLEDNEISIILNEGEY